LEVWVERSERIRPIARSGSTRQVSYVAPRNDLERQVAQAWEELLGLERVGIKENFFDLGGHSLLAIRLASRLREIFRMEIPLQKFFQSPTIAGLSDAIAALENEKKESEEAKIISMIGQLSDEEVEREMTRRMKPPT
ncbi:MAG: phosphopantetheine-binding protein, partial [Blastocatellia bacterium]